MFAGTGLAGADQMNAVVLLSGHVRNTHAAAAAGTQPWTSGHRLDPALAPLIRARADQFPAIIRAADTPGTGAADARAFGLARILDGLKLLMKPS